MPFRATTIVRVCAATHGTPSAPTPPAAPVMTAVPGNTVVDLSWETPANGGSPITGYGIFNGFTTVATPAAGDNSYQVTGLTNGTAYYLWMLATNAYGASPASVFVPTTPVSTLAPDPPVLTGTSGDAFVDLSWTVPDDHNDAIVSYGILRDGAILATVDVPTTTYRDSPLTNGSGPFSYTVTATNSAGTSVPSNTEIESPVGQAVPGASVLTGTPGVGRSNLSWTAAANNGAAVTAYRIYRDDGAGGPIVLYQTVGNVLTYADTTVTIGLPYRYLIHAVNAGGEGATSNTVTVTPTASKPDPPILTATAGDASADLSWTVPANGGSAITGYGVFIGGAGITIVPAGTTTYHDTGLTNNTAYSYTVTAVNVVASSDPSNAVSVTPFSSGGVNPPPDIVNADGAWRALGWGNELGTNAATWGPRGYGGIIHNVGFLTGFGGTARYQGSSVAGLTGAQWGIQQAMENTKAAFVANGFEMYIGPYQKNYYNGGPFKWWDDVEFALWVSRNAEMAAACQFCGYHGTRFDNEGGSPNYSNTMRERQTITITGAPTGGTFTLTFNGQTTAPIARNATYLQVRAALEGLATPVPGDFVTAGGPLPGTVTVDFDGQYRGVNVPQMTFTSSLTGGSSPTVVIQTLWDGHTQQQAIDRLTDWGYQTSKAWHQNMPNCIMVAYMWHPLGGWADYVYQQESNPEGFLDHYWFVGWARAMGEFGGPGARLISITPWAYKSGSHIANVPTTNAHKWNTQGAISKFATYFTQAEWNKIGHRIDFSFFNWSGTDMSLKAAQTGNADAGTNIVTMPAHNLTANNASRRYAMVQNASAFGLQDFRDYWIGVVDADHFYLALSNGGAAVDLTAGGTMTIEPFGTHTSYYTSSTAEFAGQLPLARQYGMGSRRGYYDYGGGPDNLSMSDYWHRTSGVAANNLVTPKSLPSNWRGGPFGPYLAAMQSAASRAAPINTTKPTIRRLSNNVLDQVDVSVIGGSAPNKTYRIAFKAQHLDGVRGGKVYNKTRNPALAESGVVIAKPVRNLAGGTLQTSLDAEYMECTCDIVGNTGERVFVFGVSVHDQTRGIALTLP